MEQNEKNRGFTLKNLLEPFIAKMKTNRKFEIGVYVALIALVILIYALTSFTGGGDSGTGTAADSAEQTAVMTRSEAELESRLKAVLESIRGAGEVEVMITYDTGVEIVPAMSVDRQTSSSDGQQSSTTSSTESSEPATLSQQGGNEPIVLTEKQPTIRGVIVIAEGAADISVQLDLQRAVQTVLGVPISAIEVFEMTTKREGNGR